MVDYSKIPTAGVIADTAENLAKNGFYVFIVKDRAAAFQEVMKMLGPHKNVMTGSSTTLKEIGFTGALSGGRLIVHDLHKDIRAEDDMIKKSDLRRRSTSADIFLSSVNAVTEDGELVAVDTTGRRTSAILYAAKKNILVIGANKIVLDLYAAFKRIRDYVYPLEDQRTMAAYNTHSSMNKWAVLANDIPGRTSVVLVKERLGF